MGAHAPKAGIFLFLSLATKISRFGRLWYNVTMQSHPSGTASSGTAPTAGEVIIAELVEPPLVAGAPAMILEPRRRRIALPAFLFVATCVSTFWVGAGGWDLLIAITEPLATLRDHWRQGAVFMAAVMGILLAHEMGHFLQAVRYRVPASLPYFIPMPLMPLGTMGAVIGLGGSQADRKQLFDIGLTGPLAGLAVALPLTCLGFLYAAPLTQTSDVGLPGHFTSPLIFDLLQAVLRPHEPPGTRFILHTNPLVMAGWIGMLVTGLNMLPVGQLDGGHVTYALMGRRAHWVARAVVLSALVFIVWSGQFGWGLMLAIVLILGIRHPPTADDRVELGRWRSIVGWLSLSIPILCLTPVPMAA